MTAPIKGYEDRYWIHSSGRVISLPNKSWSTVRLLTNKDFRGYRRVGLNCKGKLVNKQVHRLVAEAFIPNPENKPQVNHKNGIKDDNRIENLEWATASENTKHSFDNKLQVAPKGSASPVSKLTEEQVLAIRADTRSQSKIAKDFGVSQSNISLIKLRQRFKHI